MLRSDGSWLLPNLPVKKLKRSQEVFAKEAARRSKQRNQSPDVLVPHRPKA